MARIQYINVPEKDLGAGIDQQSSENQIAPGYCEDIQDADPKPTGQIIKRTGYQGYSGNLPVRISRVDYFNTSNQMCFTLDGSIELPNGKSSPLIIMGKTSDSISGTGGDFSTTETIKYYSGFIADNRITFNTGTGTVTEDDSIITTTPFLGVAQSSSEANNNNTQISVDAITVDASALNSKGYYDISVDYQNNTGAATRNFVFATDKTATDGDVYISGSTTVTNGMYNNISILSTTHELTTNRILAKVYQIDGTDRILIQPDNITLNSVTGDVNVYINNFTGSDFSVIVVLSRAPADNIATGSVAASSNASITIDTSVTGGTDFAFIGCYLDDGSEPLEAVLPDSIVNNTSTQTITVSFTNNAASGANFELYWEFASVTTNTLCVTPDTTITGDDTDLSPQLTLFGLDHSEIYGNKIAREGWTHYIDSYNAPSENRVLSGLGGVFYASRLRSEGSNSTSYLLPEFYPNLQNTLSSTDFILGPVFYDTGESPARTRGYITGDNMGNNLAEITNIAYNSSTGYTDYTLTISNLTISGTLSTIINTSVLTPDTVEFSQCGYSFHNGSFLVKAVTNPTSTTLVVSVSNPNIDISDYDESDVGGYAGIFSDQLVVTGTNNFIPGDIVKASLIPSNLGLEVTSTSGTTLVINNATEVISLAGGLAIFGERTSSIVPARNIVGTSTVDNIVRGDMLTYTPLKRQLRVNSINALSDITLSITGDGTTATAVMGSGDTSSLFIGKKLLLKDTASYFGAVEITDIPTTTSFEFSSTATASESAIMTGLTIEVDEDLSYEDLSDSSNIFRVHSRWIPIESPTDSFTLTPKTRRIYTDTNTYSNQPITRSTTVQDNMYLTNLDDEVLKFDGTNIYRAGLFRWQPDGFLTLDTNATGKIDIQNPFQVYDSVDSNKFIFTTIPEDVRSFNVGDRIRDAEDDKDYTITKIETDTNTSTGTLTRGEITVNKIISSSGTGVSIYRVSIFSYYFRLNAIDRNNNIVASAVTGSNDFLVELSADAAVNIKLIGMPIWDIYDYDRLEVQIYRTKANTSSPFFLLTTIAMTFNTGDGYIEYTDSDSDDTLRDFDNTNTALKGAELGVSFSEPMRAKYCTSAGNRLVLGNLKDYPELDIQLFPKQTKLTESDFTDYPFLEFRKDNTDTESGTNMLDRVRYEFKDVSTALNITGRTGINADKTYVDLTLSSVAGLSAGNWIYCFTDLTGTRDLDFAGWFQITQVDGGLVRVRISYNYETFPTGSFSNKALVATNPFDVPVPIGTDNNYDMRNSNPDTNILSYTSEAMTRLSKAINASMRMTDTTISGYEDFEPWLTAQAGGDFNSGQLLVRQPRVFSTNLEVVTPQKSPQYDRFVNQFKRSTSFNFATGDVNTTNEEITIASHGLVTGDYIQFITTSTLPAPLAAVTNYYVIKVDDNTISVATTYANAISLTAINLTSVGVGTHTLLAGTSAGANTRVFPSRIIASYPNFPEIFDNPRAQLDSDSPSAIDINSADGQEITAIIPFFGDAAFGASQKSGIVVVFKTNSIYLVDLNAKASGLNPVQKLETNDKGCTSPLSVSVTRNGIMFANDTGVYKLKRDLQIEYIGQKYERKYLSEVERDNLSIATGHHDGIENKYKLSYPIINEVENSKVAVYNHTREYQSQAGTGSWTTYTNHPATGWCNLQSLSLFSSTSGRVFNIRRLREKEDYRDDSSPIEMDILTRAMDMGDGSRRKIIGKIITHYRTLFGSTGTTLQAALDLSTIFQDTDAFQIISDIDDTGLSDEGSKKIQTIVSGLDEKVCVYVQLRYKNSEIDECIEIAGIDLRVAVKTVHGMTEAAETIT